MIHQLVGASIICLLDDVRPLLHGLEFSFRLVRDDDGAPKYEHQLAPPEGTLLGKLVIGSGHVLPI